MRAIGLIAFAVFEFITGRSICNERSSSSAKACITGATPTVEVASRHRLRSGNRNRFIVPRCRLNTYGRRAFPVAGPTVWNSLPDELRYHRRVMLTALNISLKQSCLAFASAIIALDDVNFNVTSGQKACDLCHSIRLWPPFSALRASTRPEASIHSMRWRCSVAASYKDADDASPR